MNSSGITLIGPYHSPYTRLVAMALMVTDTEFKHLPLAPAIPDEAEQIRQFNPLGRVPVLITSSGLPLRESRVILDWLDLHVGPDKALMSPKPETRFAQLQDVSLATGIIDRFVSLFYESWRPEELRWNQWISHQTRSAKLALGELEQRVQQNSIKPENIDLPLLTTFVAIHYGIVVASEVVDTHELPKLMELYESVKRMQCFSLLVNA